MATSSRIGRSRSPFRSDETSAKITPKALFRLGSYKPFEFFLYIQGQLHAAETSLPVLAHIPEDCQSLRTEVGTSRSLVSGSVVQEPPGHPMLIAWRRYQRLSPELRVTLLGEPISILSDRAETVRTPIPVLQRTQTLEQCLAVAFSLLHNLQGQVAVLQSHNQTLWHMLLQRCNGGTGLNRPFNILELPLILQDVRNTVLPAFAERLDDHDEAIRWLRARLLQSS